MTARKPTMVARARPRRLRRLLRWLLAIAWLGAFTLSHLPAERLRGLEASDKALHAAGFAGLTTLLWLVLAVDGRPARRRLPLVALAMALYGALDELTQPWFNRWASWDDWLFDCLGALASLAVLESAAWLWKAGRRRKGRKEQGCMGCRG